jgi:ribosomal protein L11 methyltransferase
MNNPFDTKTSNFKLSFQTCYKNLGYFEDFLDFAAGSVSCSEIKSTTIDAMPEDLWLVEAYFEENPEHHWKAKIIEIATLNSAEVSEIEISKVEDKDWVTEVQKNFHPFIVGRFFIASKFYEAEAKVQTLETIIINPSRAFGTGEHQTTKACIQAMEFLAQDKKFSSIADIGTGTGILAIAAKKIWTESNIICSDIEKISCEIATDNCSYNGCSNIQVIHSDGFKSFESQKFDLIISNILLKPLLDNAEDIFAHLNEDGYIVLSGFLKNQEEQIKQKYCALGFEVVESIYIDEWVALVCSIPCNNSY